MTPARRRSLLVGLAIGAVAGIGGGILWGVAGGDDSEPAEVVLDQPGAATLPSEGIPVADDVTGDLVPSVALDALGGGRVDLADLGGPAILNFWYSTCAPCVREMPAFQDAHERLGDGVRIVGVNPLDSPEAARDFAAGLGVTYELLRDPDGEAVSSLGVARYPTTYFVGADGRILRQKAGELTADEIAELSRELFGVAA